MGRIQPDLPAWLDTERAKQDPEPRRPDLVRTYLEDRRCGILP